MDGEGLALAGLGAGLEEIPEKLAAAGEDDLGGGGEEEEEEGPFRDVRVRSFMNHASCLVASRAKYNARATTPTRGRLNENSKGCFAKKVLKLGKESKLDRRTFFVEVKQKQKLGAESFKVSCYFSS